jgi:flagellar protein FlgJ
VIDSPALNLAASNLTASNLNQAQVYTDLSGLQNIKTLAKTDKNAALATIAKQFESMMMQMMMKSMREANSVFSEGDITSSSEEKFYQDMSDQQLTLSLSQGKGMGIATALMRQLQSRFDPAAVAKDPALAAKTKIDGLTKIDKSSAALQRGSAPALPAPTNTVAAAAIQEAMHALFGSNAQFGSSDAENLLNPSADSAPLDGTPENFVERLRPAAERVAQQLGVDSRVLLSQSALETGWGQKILQCADGSSSFNFFNIKADDNWTGATVTVPTIEYQDGVAVREYAKFRAYASPEESFADYAKLIAENPRYKNALDCADDPRAYVQALAKSGYATDPHYAQKVIAVLDGEHITPSSAR